MSFATAMLGGIGGAILGFFAGGTGTAALQGLQVGTFIGALIDPATSPKIIGPRLKDLTVQTSTYGAVIPRVYGTVALCGNIFWLENNQLKEVSKKNKSQGKGGGSKTSSRTYSYYATFAVGLCEGPISGVRRIWIGKKLIYNAGSSDVQTVIASNNIASGFTIHNGSDTQQPNSRMQSTLGVANTPAYRGLAYIVFYDLALAEYGNTLANTQIRVEIVAQQTLQPISTIATQNLYLDNGTYGSTALYMSSDSEMSIFHTPRWYEAGTPTSYYKCLFGTPRRLITSRAGVGYMHIDGWSDEASWVTTNGSGSTLLIYNRYNILEKQISGFPEQLQPQRSEYHKRGSERVLMLQGLTMSYIFDLSGSNAKVILQTVYESLYGRTHAIFLGQSFNYSITNPYAPYFICHDKSWNVLWAVSIPSPLINFGHAVGGGSVVIREQSNGQCILRNDLKFFRVNSSGYTHLGSVATVADEAHGGHHLVGNLWFEYNSQYGRIDVTSLEQKTDQVQTLAGIIRAECLKSTILTDADISIAGLTQTIRGYMVSSVAAIRSSLLPLQGAYPFDIIQRGYQIHFKARGSASVVTIPAKDLGAETLT